MDLRNDADPVPQEPEDIDDKKPSEEIGLS